MFYGIYRIDGDRFTPVFDPVPVQMAALEHDGDCLTFESGHDGSWEFFRYNPRTPSACLYHDPDDKLMIWMLPFGKEDIAQQQAIMNQAKAMGYYKLRVVENAGDLMEKVIIFNCGLDDRCIELVKYVALKEMEGVSNLHFYRMQDDVMVFSGVKAGKMEGFGFGINVYEDCAGILQRNPAIAAENGFEKIDAAWVAGIMA